MDETGRLQGSQRPPPDFAGCFGYRFQECQRDVDPDDRRLLQQQFLLAWEPVDAGGNHGLHRRRHMQGVHLGD